MACILIVVISFILPVSQIGVSHSILNLFVPTVVIAHNGSENGLTHGGLYRIPTLYT